MRVKSPLRRVTVRVVGPESENGHIPLTDFIRQLEVVREALVQTDRALAGDSGRSYWRVVDLRHSSPATVVLEEVSKSEIPHRPIAAVFARTLGLLSRSAEVPDSQKDLAALEAYRELGAVAKRTAQFDIVVGRKRVRISDAFRENLNKVIGPDELVHGSVMGALEAINLHKKLRFYIYPTVGAKRIACAFPASLKNQVIGALDRYVRVSGTLRYKSWAQFAHAIDLTDLEVMPEESDLPKLADLRGIAPDATGGLPAAEFIEGLRDADW